MFEKAPEAQDPSESDVAGDVFEDVPPDGAVAVAQVDFRGMMETPPLHHINDTAAKGLGNVMSSFDSTVHGAKQICKMLREREYRPRLLERCFACGIGRCYHTQIKKFRGHIHLERWATWAFSVPEILNIAQIFRWGWDKDKFVRGDAQHTAASDTATVVNDVDTACTSPKFWAMLVVLKHTAKFMRSATAFAEICPCHRHLLGQPVLEVLKEAGLKDLITQWEDLLGVCSHTVDHSEALQYKFDIQTIYD